MKNFCFVTIFAHNKVVGTIKKQYTSYEGRVDDVLTQTGQGNRHTRIVIKRVESPYFLLANSMPNSSKHPYIEKDNMLSVSFRP